MIKDVIEKSNRERKAHYCTIKLINKELIQRHQIVEEVARKTIFLIILMEETRMSRKIKQQCRLKKSSVEIDDSKQLITLLSFIMKNDETLYAENYKDI